MESSTIEKYMTYSYKALSNENHQVADEPGEICMDKA
jgi:hypothetical protein